MSGQVAPEGQPPVDPSQLQLVNGVLIGRDDELFLMGGMHWIYRFALGMGQIEEKHIRTFRENLQTRRRIADAYGIPYVHIIAPEKYVIYPENMPFEPRGSMAEPYLRNHENADLIYPCEILVNNALGRSYDRTDTHWSAAGRVAMALMIARRAGLPSSAIERGEAVLKAAISGPPVLNFAGDLGRKFSPPRQEKALLFRRPYPVQLSENGLVHLDGTTHNDGRLIVAESGCPEALDRSLLIFGDSYLHLTIDYLAAFFKRIVFCRSRFIHAEMVAMVRPDMIVSENAERYLSGVESDREAPPFLMVPYLLGRQPRFELPAATEIARMLRPNLAYTKDEPS
jgi:hypothetical protein